MQLFQVSRFFLLFLPPLRLLDSLHAAHPSLPVLDCQNISILFSSDGEPVSLVLWEEVECFAETRGFL
jgi:hypothetical protein